LPLLPYALGAGSLWISGIVAVLALFGAGVAASRFTSRGWVYSGARQLMFGMVAAAVTYGVGSLFHAVT
jgi:vacuolar iron transporter family protein